MFYTYKNIPRKFVRIHRAKCPSCNNGNGIHQEINIGANGGWDGPFKKYQIALAHANEVVLNELHEGAEIFNCGRCNPQIN